MDSTLKQILRELYDAQSAGLRLQDTVKVLQTQIATLDARLAAMPVAAPTEAP